MDPTTTGGRGHGDLHMKVSPAIDLSFCNFYSIEILFFYMLLPQLRFAL
jgi:hypothetical protein